MSISIRAWVAASVLGVSAAMALPAFASEEQTAYRFDLPAQPLAETLRVIARQTGTNVLFESKDLVGIAAPALQEKLTAAEAIERVLAGTRLSAQQTTPRTVVIQPAESVSSSLSTETDGSESAIAGDIRLAQVDPLSGTQDASTLKEDEGRKDKLEEVVVQGARRKFAPTESSAATKIGLELVETPQSMTVLSSELLDIVGSRSLASVSTLAPSATNSEGDIPIRSIFNVRGFEVSGATGFKINGMPVDDGAFTSIGTGIFDRIEVVRGPASIIYGQASYGATINMTLKGPQKKPAFAGELGYGDKGTVSGSLDTTGLLTQDGRLRGRMVMIYENYQPPQDFAFARTTTFMPSLSWDIADDTTLDLYYLHADSLNRADLGFPLIQDSAGVLSLPDVPRDAFYSADFAKMKGKMDFGLAKLTHHFGAGWVLTVEGSHQGSFTSQHRPTPAGLADANGMTTMVEDKVLQDTVSSASQVTLTRDFQAWGGEHTLLLDGYYLKQTNSFIGVGGTALGPLNIFDPDPKAYVPANPDFPETIDVSGGVPDDLLFQGRLLRKNTGYSALLLSHPTERLSVMLGLRYNGFTAETTDVYDHSVSQQNPPVIKTDSVDKRVGVVYKLPRNINIYGSYSTGTIFNTAIDYKGDSIPQETGVQWEFGAKTALFDKRLTVSAAAYTIDRRNVAVQDPDRLNTPFNIGIDGQKHSGFELEAIGEPVPGWNILTSYSYVNTEISMPGDPLGWNGHQQANTPRNQFKLYTTYQLLGGPLQGLSFGGGVFNASSREANNAGAFRLPGATSLDLRLGYDRERVSYSLNLFNVTDENIYATVFSNLTTVALQNRRSALFKVNFKY